MRIGGLRKTTLLDYPGKVACTVFLPGCNLRCPYCHNASLVLPDRMAPESLSVEELVAFLERRRGKLDGVCITGGEPTIYKDLPELAARIRDLGFSLKLDTNGSHPQMLRTMLAYADYVAMDIKNSPDRYRLTCGGPEILPKVKESAAMLMEGTTPFEFRTTVCAPFHDEESMEAIGRWLAGPEPYFLQGFVDSGDLVGSGIAALSPEKMEDLRRVLLPWMPNTSIRGI